jgi:SAM-dependent methyltransferase
MHFVDLGAAPASNAYLSPEDLNRPEQWFPLRVLVCTQCWLVQTEDFARHDELFDSDYAYFSSYSQSWLRHAQAYVQEVVDRFRLGPQSKVIEVAANDGYLLQYVRARDIPCLGIEPTASTAAAARTKGIEVDESFFGRDCARRLLEEGHASDLMVANNVLAHVPDINDFVAGFACLLKPHGVATFEFPHLMRLVERAQFDTVYHEHFSYLSLSTVTRCFARNGLEVFDVDELSTHGGSLRAYAQRLDCSGRRRESAVDALLEREERAGMQTTAYYASFQARAERIKNDLLTFLLRARYDGKLVAAYGAAAKGNTLLNFAGVRADLVEFVVDRNPAKQDRFMPGSRIPIVPEERLSQARPDYLLLLPWNLRAELEAQLEYIGQWGARFVTAVPSLEIWP